MNLFDFYNGKVVLITGGSMGIGRELASQILQYGGKVIITGRKPERLQLVKNELVANQKNLLTHVGNVGDYSNNIQLIEKIILHFGKLDILINNAGMSAYGDLEKYDYKVINEIIDTNIKGFLFPTIVAIPELKKTNGSVIFISSIAAFRGLPNYSLYSLSKMSQTSIVQSLRIELKANNVFAGIAYVGFTQNETEKRMLTADGKLEEVPARNKLATVSRKVTAKKILKQIEAKKPRVIHSAIGKLTYFLSKYLPFVLNKIYAVHYNKKNISNG